MDKNYRYMIAWNPNDPSCTHLHQEPKDKADDYCEMMCRLQAAIAFGLSPVEVAFVYIDPANKKQCRDVEKFLTACKNGGTILSVITKDDGTYVGLWASQVCPDLENAKYMECSTKTGKWKYIPNWQDVKRLDELLAQEAEHIEKIEDKERRSVRSMRALTLEQFGGPAADANDKKHFYQFCHDIEELRSALSLVRAEILDVRARLSK